MHNPCGLSQRSSQHIWRRIKYQVHLEKECTAAHATSKDNMQDALISLRMSWLPFVPFCRQGILDLLVFTTHKGRKIWVSMEEMGTCLQGNVL